MRLASLLEANSDELSGIGVLENGTPIAFAALACVDAPVDWLRYYAGWVDKLEGRVQPAHPIASHSYSVHQPYGVVGLLIAYNAPQAFIGMKVSPALAAGNTVVLKPSEQAPWSSLRFGELCLEAGIPPGVVNVVPGNAVAGQALARHPGVNKLSFTGGAATATSIVQAAATQLTPVALELGGKSASIIFDDADLDTALATAAQIGFVVQTGQACIAGSRILAHRRIHDEVVETLVDLAESVVVGDPSDHGTLMGPLISEGHRERVLATVADAERSGAGRRLVGGERMDELGSGFFMSPAVFADVDPASPLAREEIFGPVVAVIPFDTEDEAVALANDSDYGLAGYVFTEHLARAHRVAGALDAGYVSVNTFNALPATAPFGGFKRSGYGREGGWEGLLEMCQVKNVHIALG
jgi:aldehyde dehydrogenase (NAD+)